jgi:cation diffusion facilitator CzcD-associated flavoprotein CzcO
MGSLPPIPDPKPASSDAAAAFTSAFNVSSLSSLAEQCGWPRKNAAGYEIQEQLFGSKRAMRIIHIGAGVSGICMAKFLGELTSQVDLVCYDKNADVGGTWLENRYPGCACDIPSVNYQFTWARNPNWSRFYSYATEIWQYLRDVVDEYGLERYMKLRHEVVHAAWNDEQGVWEVSVKNLETGATFVDRAEVLVNGSGVLK